MDGEISDSLPTLSVMYPVVFSDLRATFKRASERKIHQCSMDLCLIALCVRYGKLIYDSHRVVWIEQGRYHLWVDRTGYLFDAFVPSVSHTTTPAQTFAGLLIKLREVSCSCRHCLHALSGRVRHTACCLSSPLPEYNRVLADRQA